MGTLLTDEPVGDDDIDETEIEGNEGNEGNEANNDQGSNNEGLKTDDGTEDAEDADDTQSDEDKINPQKPQKGNSRQKSSGFHRTTLSTLYNMGKRDLDMIANILSYSQDFDTALSSKKARKIDELSPSMEIVPTFGSDIPKVDTDELALLNNPQTELLFLSKLADSSLSIRAPFENRRQPVTMCIDASGSMMGSNYEIACGFTIAMLKKLKSDRRGGAFVVFSDTVTNSITITTDKRFSMNEILKVLMTPKFGGTNFDIAMLEAYKIKEEEKWKNMTTLMITDGGDSLSANVWETISKKKSKRDHISMVLTSGSDAGFRGLNDDSIRVTKRNMFVELTKIGNAVL